MEYLLADSQPPHLFILRKMYRHSGGGTITTLAFYYILDGSIYQAPSLQAALLARMVRRGVPCAASRPHRLQAGHLRLITPAAA